LVTAAPFGTAARKSIRQMIHRVYRDNFTQFR